MEILSVVCYYHVVLEGGTFCTLDLGTTKDDTTTTVNIDNGHVLLTLSEFPIVDLSNTLFYRYRF